VGADTPLLVVVAELSRNKRPADVIEALALMSHHRSPARLCRSGDQAPFQALAGAGEFCRIACGSRAWSAMSGR
jgi:hypothetical protein